MYENYHFAYDILNLTCFDHFINLHEFKATKNITYYHFTVVSYVTLTLYRYPNDIRLCKIISINNPFNYQQK